MSSPSDSALSLLASANPLAHLLEGQHGWVIAFGGLLLAISLFAWSVIVTKAMALRRTNKTDAIFLEHFRDSTHPLQVFGKNVSSRGSLLHGVYTLGARELAYHWLGSSEVDETFEPRLRRADPMSDRETRLFRTRLRCIADETGQSLTRSMSFLDGLVSSVPLLGLLATAWGLMAAAGISGEALAATQPSIGTILSMSVLALLVAVPAGIAVRLLNHHLQRKDREVHRFCRELDTAISTSYHDPASIAVALKEPMAGKEVAIAEESEDPDAEIEVEAPAAQEAEIVAAVRFEEDTPLLFEVEEVDTLEELATPEVQEPVMDEESLEAEDLAEIDEAPEAEPAPVEAAPKATPIPVAEAESEATVEPEAELEIEPEPQAAPVAAASQTPPAHASATSPLAPPLPSPAKGPVFDDAEIAALLERPLDAAGATDPSAPSEHFVGEQLSFGGADEAEQGEGYDEFDDEPMINPVARQTIMKAPELILNQQV